MNTRQQRDLIAKDQRQWAAQALRDARSNKRNAQRNRKKGNYVLARQLDQESRWDTFWGKRRLRIANKYHPR